MNPFNYKDFLKSKLIVFEGIDGAGKGTHAYNLFHHLVENKEHSLLFTFPSYLETHSSKIIAEALSNPEIKIKPEIMASLFALDKFEKKNEIEEALKQGCVVICDRWTYSNIAYQRARCETKEQADKLEKFIYKLEQETYNLPIPTVCLYLDVSPIMAVKRIEKKNPRKYTDKKKDAYEDDFNLLIRARENYLSLCKQGLMIKINTEDKYKGDERTVEEIDKEILDVLRIK